MELKHGTLALENFSDEQQAKIVRCIDLIIRAANTDEFKQKILTFKHTEQVPVGTTGKLWWKKTIYKEVSTPGFYFTDGETVYSNPDVLQKIFEAAEEETTAKNRCMDLHLVGASKRWTSATAYGYAGQDKIVIYHNWIDSSSDAELANTIFHEWLHNLGFDHSFKYDPNRDFSVPYGAGDCLQAVIEGLG